MYICAIAKAGSHQHFAVEICIIPSDFMGLMADKVAPEEQ
jgi:hypothetical protein